MCEIMEEEMQVYLTPSQIRMIADLLEDKIGKYGVYDVQLLVANLREYLGG